MDLSFSNNQSFTRTFPLSEWSTIYDLPDGVLRCQMRPSAASAVLLYEWATSNDLRGTARGRIDLLTLKALGTFAFAANPAAGDAITIGSTAVTFVDASPSGSQVLIAPTLDGTLSALLGLLESSGDPQISQCTYALAATTLLVEFGQAGTAGNAFEIGATSVNVAVSGPTLAGGGAAAVLTAPIADMLTLPVGAAVYDLRFEAESVFAVLEGGAITIKQGVTR